MAPETVERPLAAGVVAAMFGVSVSTVASWADQGKLPYFKTPGGQRRFRPSDVEALLGADAGPEQASA